MAVDWITETVAATVANFDQTNGGRVIASLANSGSPNRQDIANLLVATLAQRRQTQAGEWLAEQMGSAYSPDENGTPELDEDRPVYTRPNGAPYYARKWGKRWDVDVLKSARENSQFPLLLGSPGTGKTAMVEAAFGEELITTVVTGDTMVSGLVGGFIPDGSGGYRWVDGPLLTAVREGRPLLVDEILLANPVVLSVLYPLMDGRGFIDVQENPEIGIVHAAKGFYLIGAANPNVPGAKLSEALGSRFPFHVTVTTDWDLAKIMGVDDRVVDALEGISLRAAGQNSSISWSPQFRELLAFKQAQEVFDREFAIHNLMSLVPKADLDEIMTVLGPLLGGLDKVMPFKI